MIRREGDRMMIVGPVTLKNVTAVLEEGLTEVRAGVSTIDMAEVSELDSSLLAATFAWVREGRLANRALTVANLPAGLQTLAQLYGVEELLPLTTGH
ncbi:MAG: STAS domain-containing protein [Proteobacteria bacterium]|nr:STAS domain-containing protein [Pseudomonadota bacterium]